MKVRLSSDARAYIAKETRYLKARSRVGAEGFRNIIRRVEKWVADFPQSGITDSAIPLTNARRVIADGYLFDYDIIDGVVWIQNIRSSVAVMTIEVEDDLDYEAETEPPGSKRPGER